MKNIKVTKRDRRHAKIRARLSGTADCPRLSIFKSNRYLYAQLIDDDAQKTLLSSSTLANEGKNTLAGAKAIGAEIAKLALAKKITKVVFDRGGFIYTGKVKAIADGAREGGLTF
ncbi:MAG: ribosomal protein large subunit ribosomal protein [Candidatus Parcubacteria bacterium]|jgi:large subunit ribosomal protein L18